MHVKCIELVFAKSMHLKISDFLYLFSKGCLVMP